MDAYNGKAVLIGLAVLLLLAIFVVGANAHTADFNSRVSLRYTDGEFVGDIDSSRASCVRGRFVRLVKVKGDELDVVAVDATNNNGRFRINRPNANGRFFVRVTREVNGGYSHVHTCRGDRSPGRTV